MGDLEFGSRAWTEHLRDVMAQALADAGDAAAGLEYSIAETYLDPPGHLAVASGELGWHARLHDGTMDFAFEPADDVDIHIIVDYQSVLPLARIVYGDGPEAVAERERILGALIGDGTLRVEGDLTKRPDFLEGVHDAMACVTV